MTGCPLTTKELECVKWLSEGHNVPDTAEIMNISKFTAQVYLREAKYKIGSATATSLVATALRKGWIT